MTQNNIVTYHRSKFNFIYRFLYKKKKRNSNGTDKYIEFCITCINELMNRAFMDSEKSISSCLSGLIGEIIFYVHL